MSIDYIDGFDEVAAADIRLWGWSASANSIQTGRIAGSCIRLTSVGPTHALVSNARQTIGFAWCPGNAGSANDIARLLEGGVTQGVIRNNGDGTLSVQRGGPSTLATSAALGLANNIWYYIELDYTCHDSTGAFELRVDGATVASGSGVDTRNGGTAGTPNTVQLVQQGSGYDFDDLYCASGSTSFQGDCRVITSLPASDGADTGWTPSTGTAHYACVDEIPQNGDTDYVSASTSVKDTYGMAALGVTGTVRAVQTGAVARKDDAGSRSIKMVVRSGGTDYSGSTQALGTSYTGFWRVDPTDPGTAAAWTVSGVNAGEYGVENV